MHRADEQQALLRAYRRGSESAARSLYAQLAPGMRACAGAILGDTSLADDAVQSTFCKVLTLSSSEVRRIQSVRAWMATLVRREALTMRRADARRGAREERGEWGDRGALGGMPSRRASMSEDNLRSAVDSLDDQRREVVILKCAMGLTFEQVALVLEINRNTAASRYRSAITRLREVLRAAGATSEDGKAVSHV